MAGFWQRVKQSKLVQWSAAYIAACFALIQVLDVVAQRFGLPDLIEKLIILALAVGFFVALVLAWYHGERGAQRVGGAELLIVALLLAIGGGVLWGYARVPAKVPVAVAAANPSRSPDEVKRNPGANIPDSAAGAAASGLRSASAQAVPIPAKSVAVLPFANESDKKDEQFFSDGLSEDLINALSQFAGLKVISRNSAFQFRDSKDSSARIGRLLGVAHLLEGSVQRAGDEVRITATLVNAADGSTLWSAHYDKPYKDLFALQDAITQAVAAALQAKLLTTPGAVVQSDRPPSGSLAAYNAYLKAKSYGALGTEAGVRKGIDALNRAIQLDPHYALAYTQLAFRWTNLSRGYLGGTQAQQAYSKARAATDTALALEPNLAWAHLVHGELLESADFDWTGAEAEYRRALELAPNDGVAKLFLGGMLATLGHSAQAIAPTRQAIAIDPRNATAHLLLGEYFASIGRLAEAEQAIHLAFGLSPGRPALYRRLTMIEIQRGDAKAALRAAQQLHGHWQADALALAQQISGDRAAADAALKTLIDKNAGTSAYQIAETYALRRDPDNMFKWLDRAWALRDSGIGFLLYDPLILRYKNDPRFAAFCKKVGLPTATDAVAMQ